MVKILLCTRNGERYLREQLDSILSQDDDGEGFRLLVSDDASGDGTREILEEYRVRYPNRISLRFRESPSGSAWRHFLSLFAEGCAADAEYIMLSDQDDVWKPEKLRQCMKHMRAMEAVWQRETPVLVHCDAELVTESLEPIAPSFTAYQKMSPSRDKLCQLLVQNHVVGGSILMNRALAALIREVPESCVMHDQWIALLAAAFGQIRYVPEALYLYRQHGENVLGAAKGSFLGEVLGRFGIGRADGKGREEVDAHSREVYRSLFKQAECFLSMYGSRLSERQRRLLKAFLSIPGRSRPGKAAVILFNGFTYNLPHRTFGELLFI